MSMEILGQSPDLVLAVLMFVGWIVLMRFVTAADGRLDLNEPNMQRGVAA